MKENLKENTLVNKAKVIVTEDFLNKTKFLCKQCPEKEWSGALIYKVEGSIADPANMIITPIDIYLMDIGSKAYTEYDTDKSIVDFIVKNNYLEYNIGKYHSHNSMNVFHSDTDMKDLEENSDKYNYYVSMICNNAMDMEMKISFYATIETEEIPYTAVNEQGEKYQLNLKETLQYKQLFIVDTIIEKAEVQFAEDDTFTKRFYEILEKSQKVQPKTFTSFDFQNRKNKFPQEQDLFNQQEINWNEEEQEENLEIDTFVCYILRDGKPLKTDTVETVIEDILVSFQDKKEIISYANQMAGVKFFNLYKSYYSQDNTAMIKEVFMDNIQEFVERLEEEEMTYPEIKPIVAAFNNMQQRYLNNLLNTDNKKKRNE